MVERRLVQVRLDADLVKATKIWAIKNDMPWPLALDALLRTALYLEPTP